MHPVSRHEANLAIAALKALGTREGLLRWLLVIELFIIPFGVESAFRDLGLAPSDLRKYLSASSDVEVYIIYFQATSYLACTMGLMFLFRWARIGWSLVNFVSVVVSLMPVWAPFFNLRSDPWSVKSEITQMLSEIDALISGAILVLIWVMKDEFAPNSPMTAPRIPTSTPD